MICKNCNNSSPEGSKFCASCGAPLTDDNTFNKSTSQSSNDEIVNDSIKTDTTNDNNVTLSVTPTDNTAVNNFFKSTKFAKSC